MKRLRFAVPPGLIPLYLLISFPFLAPYPTQLPLAAFPSPSEQTGGAARARELLWVVPAAESLFSLRL